MKKLTEYLINNFDKVKIHSKYIDKGDVFIALAGKNNHGNDFIQVAIKKGAKYIITDQKPDLNSRNKKIILVKNSLKFLKEISIKKRKLYNGKVIGITGSIGKTSIKENLKFFLTPYFIISASIKSYNNYLGVIISLINLNLKSDFAIFEIGTNDFFEIRRLTSLVKPSQVIISNIYQTHLEKLITTRNIAKEKSDIFNPKYNPNIELLVLPNLNKDDLYLNNLSKKYKINKLLTFGKKDTSTYKLSNFKLKNNKICELSIYFNNKINKFDTNILIEYQFYNLIISLIIIQHNKLNINNFYNQLKKIPLVDGRGLSHKVFLKNKRINLIDESYNASPQSVENCILYFDEMKKKKLQKKILLIGKMNELGKLEYYYHKKIVILIKKTKIDNVLFVGNIYRRILNLKKINDKRFLFFVNENELFSFFYNKLKKDDIILAKGSNSTIVNKFIKKILLNEGKI